MEEKWHDEAIVLHSQNFTNLLLAKSQFRSSLALTTSCSQKAVSLAYEKTGNSSLGSVLKKKKTCLFCLTQLFLSKN